MLWYSHMAIAGAGYALTAKLHQAPLGIAPLVGCLVASLIPDIDNVSSTIGRKLVFVSAPIQIFFGHRTITHSLWVPVAIGAYIAFWESAPLMAVAVFWGYISHLIADAWTGYGVPIFWPAKKQLVGLRLIAPPRVMSLADARIEFQEHLSDGRLPRPLYYRVIKGLPVYPPGHPKNTFAVGGKEEHLVFLGALLGIVAINMI